MHARTRCLLFLSLLFACLVPLRAQGGEEDFTLRTEFVPSSAKPGQEVTLVLHAKVRSGWHAYGTLETVSKPIKLDLEKVDLGGLEAIGAAQIPPGEPHTGPIGTQFPLPNEFDVKWKLRVPAAQKVGEVTVDGALTYQICNESGCYPPTDADFTAKLKVVGADQAEQAPTETGNSIKPGLKLVPDLMPGADEKVVAKARFEPVTVRAGESTTLVLTVTVVDGFHAYGTLETNNGQVSLDAAKMQRGGLEPVGGAIIPPGEKGEQFGMPAYPLPHVFEVKHVFRVPEGAKPGAIAISGELDCQVCDDHSCEQAAAAFRATVTVEAGEARAEGVPPPMPVEPPTATTQLDGSFGSSWWALILLSIGGGLFALAMPCTYPMIPITFSFFTKQAEKRGGRVLPLVVVYGLGIIAMFTCVGVLLSAVIIDVVNHWLTNTIIGVMFFFFAFVLFGWINLSPPQWMNRMAFKAQSSAQSQSSGLAGVMVALLGVFFMGATLVITSFTCTAPIVGSLIANIASLGKVRVGVGMGIFGLTMALPFMALALMPTKVKSMPRSGEWMDTLKISLGFVELAAAFKFVSMVDFAFGWQALPRELFLFLWTAIFGMWAMYLFGILRKAGTVNEGVGSGRMAAGMFVTLLATYFLFGALGNRLDAIMTGFVPGYSNSLVSREGGESKQHAGHALVYDDQKRAIEVAKADDKLLLYNFTGFN